MARSPVSDAQIRDVLSRYALEGEPSVSPLGSGLINDTFSVDAGGARYVLQRVHPVFSPEIHHNIAAVTRHLAAAGIPTPRLCESNTGELWVQLGADVWRMMTRLAGVSFDAVGSPAAARAAGVALGRFHGALADLDHVFVGLRAGVHDTPRHLAHLRDCVAKHTDHRLYERVAPLAEELLRSAEALPAVVGVPDRVVHGDPKFNNVLFASAQGEGALQAVGLIDLDTVGPMPLHLEMGDAWRSWCNPRGEDDADARFDLQVFEASVRGWTQARPFALSGEEREALVFGVDWITVELAARFLADALAESYFGFDATRFQTAGDHNLVRARGQLALHHRVVEQRVARAKILAG